MSKEIIFDKDEFIKLILSNIEYNSSSTDRAKEYLSQQGLNTDDILLRGRSKIQEIKAKLANLSGTPNSLAPSNVTAVSSTKSNKRSWHHKSVLKLINESGNDDPMEEIKLRARNMVLQAFELGWEGPPFSPIQLAQLLQIDVVPYDSVIDACIIPKRNSRFQIQYNPFQKPTRINFSVAHEIAHTLFSDCAESIRNREDAPMENRELEQLCNAAAAEIQLPYAIFSNDANNSEPSMKGLIALATNYKASLESVFLRYTEVIDRPCAVLIGIFQNDNQIVIDYHKSSRKFELDIPTNFVIPKDSKVYECTSPGWTSEEFATWDIFDGKNYYISSAGISSYRRDNKPRVGILILPAEHTTVSPETGKIFLEYGDATKPRGKGKKIIAQVVNTSGALGMGFGKSLAKNFPIIKEELKKWHDRKNDYILGNTNLIKVSSELYVFQMLAQKGLFAKGNDIPLKYNELRNCLVKLRETALELGCTVHMPAIGSGQAKGNWDIILGMIHDELVNYDIEVNIYLFQGKAYNPKHKSNLTLFKEDSTWETGKLF